MDSTNKESNEDADKTKKVELDAPNSLPDSLIDKFGLEAKNESKENLKKPAHPQQIPEDIIDDKASLEKIYDDSTNIEFIKTEEDEHPEINSEQTPLKEKEENDNNEDEKSQKIDETKSEMKATPSFFNKLEQYMKETKEINPNLSGNLVEMMKKFHSARSKGEHFFFHEQELEDELYKRMLKLKELEGEWIIRAKEFNTAKELLGEKEQEISKISEELNSLIKKADKFKIFNKTTTHEESFKLSNGKILLSINDLVHELQIMKDDVFKHHVNTNKNDFSDWIKHVFKEEKLAQMIRNNLDRDKMLESLKNY